MRCGHNADALSIGRGNVEVGDEVKAGGAQRVRENRARDEPAEHGQRVDRLPSSERRGARDVTRHRSATCRNTEHCRLRHDFSMPGCRITCNAHKQRGPGAAQCCPRACPCRVTRTGAGPAVSSRGSGCPRRPAPRDSVPSAQIAGMGAHNNRGLTLAGYPSAYHTTVPPSELCIASSADLPAEGTRTPEQCVARSRFGWPFSSASARHLQRRGQLHVAIVVIEKRGGAARSGGRRCQWWRRGRRTRGRGGDWRRRKRNKRVAMRRHSTVAVA